MIGSEKMKKPEDVNLNLLLTFLGREGQDMFETFDWASEEQRTLENGLAKFEAHFAGKTNITMARYRFFGYTQGSSGITEFVTGLKSLANDCDFGGLKDSLIKDMIVLHCKSEQLRERLLKEPDLDLVKACEIGKISEEAAKNADIIGHNVSEEGAFMAGSYRRWNQKGRKFASEFRGECYECGKYGHMVRDCPERKKKRFAGYSRNESRTELPEPETFSGGNKGNEPEISDGGKFAFAAVDGERNSKDTWYIDSGATKHMASDRETFEWYCKFRKRRKIQLGDERCQWACGEGEVKLKVRTSKGSSNIVPRNVLHVPGLRGSLFSVRATTGLGNTAFFKGTRCQLSSGSGHCNVWCDQDKNELFVVPTVGV